MQLALNSMERRFFFGQIKAAIDPALAQRLSGKSSEHMNASDFDDKLRHPSASFKKEGSELSGFQGSRCGPVMNSIGIVHNWSYFWCLLQSQRRHCSQHHPQQFNESIGIWQQAKPKIPPRCSHPLGPWINIPSDVSNFLTLRVSLLGTDSEKGGSWCCSCTCGHPEPHQKAIPIKWAVF